MLLGNAIAHLELVSIKKAPFVAVLQGKLLIFHSNGIAQQAFEHHQLVVLFSIVCVTLGVMNARHFSLHLTQCWCHLFDRTLVPYLLFLEPLNFAIFDSLRSIRRLRACFGWS